LKSAEIYQKIEIKCYNYFYEIYVQDKLIFSFSDDRFEGGRYGVIIGPLSLAKMDYYNVYDLTIPGKPSTVPVKKLVERIDSLAKQNENLRKELIEKKFNTKDQNIVEIMNTMEKRIEVLVQENKELKNIVADYENNSVTSVTNDSKSETDLNTQKLNALTTERDELKRKVEQLELKLNNSKNEQNKVDISLNAKDEIIKEENVAKNVAKNAKEIKVEESNLSEKNEKVDELRSTKNKTESKEELAKQINDIKIQEPIFKPSENNQEKYFPEIDELRVPVKKSSIKQ
jgi:myosin heavy subunit